MKIKNFLNIVNYVEKGWGFEAWIANSPLYCGKLLCLDKKKKFSWHRHEQKDETFFCVKGKATLYYSSDDCMEDGKFNRKLANKIKLKPGIAFHIPVGMRHQVVAKKKTYLIEVSTEHFDTDSIRLEKGD